MKRNIDGSLYSELTDRFTVLGHLFTTESTESILYLSYQKVKIFTNNGTELFALKYIEGDGMFENYTISKSGEKIFHSREFLPFEEIPKNRNFTFNCYGQSFCDSQFWLNLTTGEEERIIKDNSLDSSDKISEIKTGSKILLYQDKQLIHAMLVVENNEILGKDGTQNLKKFSDFNEFQSNTNYVLIKSEY